MVERLREICQLNGASGDEERVREHIKSKISADEVFTDNLGNLIAFKRGKKTPKHKLMFAAHMDEVGFMITDIGENGFLSFGEVGGINPAAVLGRGLVLESGALGVVGTKAIHQQSPDERKKMPDFGELYIDIGASSRGEAEKLAPLGSYAYFDADFFEFGDGFVKGKAIDDRAGCLIMMDMINGEPEYDAWYAFTVQEEVGTRGAKAAAFTVAPDIAVVLETTTACDIAGTSGAKRVCELGKGAVVSYIDRGTVYDRELYSLAFETAKANGIPAQTKTLVAGGNDSGAIHVSAGGVRTCAVSVPCRYLHSPSCVIKLSDFYAVKALAEKLLSVFGEL
ncbi:MAG: M42 family peptidase [Lachnospiraceae bacterium]|nr:M42 family peptidase [Ruminococcus sp.]MCM1274015.1 M42 family peptidase [Lachnospiraceae bacterium]